MSEVISSSFFVENGFRANLGSGKHLWESGVRNGSSLNFMRVVRNFYTRAQSIRLCEIVDSTLCFMRLSVRLVSLEKSGIVFLSNGGSGCRTLVLRLEIHSKGFSVGMRVFGHFELLFGWKLVSSESWVW